MGGPEVYKEMFLFLKQQRFLIASYLTKAATYLWHPGEKVHVCDLTLKNACP